VSGSRDSTVSLWYADGRGEIGVLERHGGWFGATGGFSPDGALVVTSSFDGRVVVHHTDMSQEPITVADQEREVYNPKFTPDGQHILGTSDDDKVRVWSLDGGGETEVVAEHKGLWGTALSSDGLLLATTSYVDNTCRIWTLGSTDPPTILIGHSNEVYGVAFSPDNRRIVTSSIDNTVRVWDVETGADLLCVHGNNNALQAATFSPDGTRLLAYHRNRARVLRVTWEGLADYLRRNAGGCLKPKDRERFLGETPSEAWAAYAECEHRFGRTPSADRPE
jgi:WD40 repeat protein